MRCKFICKSLSKSLGSLSVHDGHGNLSWEEGVVYSLIMDPVRPNNDPEHENSKFFAATPSGSLQLTCVREESVKDIEVGKEYFLDITPA